MTIILKRWEHFCHKNALSTTLSLLENCPSAFMGKDHGRDCPSPWLDNLHTPTPYQDIFHIRLNSNLYAYMGYILLFRPLFVIAEDTYFYVWDFGTLEENWVGGDWFSVLNVYFTILWKTNIGEDCSMLWLVVLAMFLV